MPLPIAHIIHVTCIINISYLDAIAMYLLYYYLVLVRCTMENIVYDVCSMLHGVLSVWCVFCVYEMEMGFLEAKEFGLLSIEKKTEVKVRYRCKI